MAPIAGEKGHVLIRPAIRRTGQSFTAQAVLSDTLAVVSGGIDAPANFGVLVPNTLQVSLHCGHGYAEWQREGFVGCSVPDSDKYFSFAGRKLPSARGIIAAK